MWYVILFSVKHLEHDRYACILPGFEISWGRNGGRTLSMLGSLLCPFTDGRGVSPSHPHQSCLQKHAGNPWSCLRVPKLLPAQVEELFWRTKYRKSKISSKISDNHPENSLRIATAAIRPDWCASFTKARSNIPLVVCFCCSFYVLIRRYFKVSFATSIH